MQRFLQCACTHALAYLLKRGYAKVPAVCLRTCACMLARPGLLEPRARSANQFSSHGHRCALTPHTHSFCMSSTAKVAACCHFPSKRPCAWSTREVRRLHTLAEVRIQGLFGAPQMHECLHTHAKSSCMHRGAAGARARQGLRLLL